MELSTGGYYIPHEGDLAFYTAHTSIVLAGRSDDFYSIDGNSQNMVRTREIPYTTPSLNGFGDNGSTSYGMIPAIYSSGIDSTT